MSRITRSPAGPAFPSRASVAHGQETEASDIDLLVAREGDDTLLTLAGLPEEPFSRLGCGVDVPTSDPL